MEDLTHCNLCGSSAFETIGRKRGARTGHLFTIRKCHECGLVFIAPRLTQEENQSLYDEAYFNGQGFDVSINYSELDVQGRKLENEGTIAKLRVFRPERDLRILDVGCGTGSLLGALRAEGYPCVEGVEFSEYAGQVARKHAGVPVHIGDILELDLGRERFDVINATEVVEHVRDPRAFFKRITALLAPGGIFVYSTGNVESPHARIFRSAWPYIIPEGHLFYFSPSTLRRYFANVGLTAIELDDLPSLKRKALIRAEQLMAHAQLLNIAHSDGALKGKAYAAVAHIPRRIGDPLITWLASKHVLPTARKPK